MKSTRTELTLKWLLHTLKGVSAWVVLWIAATWFDTSPLFQWISVNNPLTVVAPMLESQVLVHTMLFVGLLLWFVLTFGLFVYILRNFHFDDKKKSRPSIADAIEYQNMVRKKIQEREQASENTKES